MIVSFCWAYAGPVWASEDSGENPFPEGFNFDELPEIDDLPPIEPLKEPTETLQTNKNIEASLAKKESDNVFIPSVESKKSLPAAVMVPKKNDIERERIIIPKKKNSVSENSSEKSLTKALKESSEERKTSNFIEGTWVEKLTSYNPLTLLGMESEDTNEYDEDVYELFEDDEEDFDKQDLEFLIKKSRKKNKFGKSNAAVFDISGVMLKMTLPQVERTLENRGFRKVNAKFQIPNFIKWRGEETCRNQGVVGFERLEACVITLAKKDGHQYLQYLKYAKFDSKEEIEVYFTSNFTENKVYKIFYKSNIATITGNSPKAIYIRNIKVYDFWKKINQKYGAPDNKTTVVWGLGGNKPYLKAATGRLLLEDPMFRELDYTRMSREDQRFINSEFYNF